MNLDKNRTGRPLVGIALLAYNYGRYIDEAIESLKQQTFQDFEVFLMDDGSDDGETAEKLAKLEYDKISKKYLYKENRGNAKRRRDQYKKMENKYILDMSGDDKLAPEFLEKCVNYLESHPGCGAVSTGIKEYLDEFTGEPYVEFYYDEKKMKMPEMLAECHFLGSSLMRNEAVKQTDFSGGFVRYLDWDKWISMLEAGWALGTIREPLFMYRIHGDSLSHSSSAESETEVFKKIIEKHKKLYAENYQYVESQLFHNMFAVTRNSDALVRSIEELKRANVALAKENEALMEDLRVSKMTFKNRVIGKLKKLLGQK